MEFSSFLEQLIHESGDAYKLFKVDMATKKNLAGKYHIETVPAAVVLTKGEELKRLNCCMDKEQIKYQLFKGE